MVKREIFPILNELQLLSLILEGESLKVDFKRQLDLKTQKGKAEFVKDIISLANSSPEARLYSCRIK